MNFLESTFRLLEYNQKFPYYHAERRIDIFINLFIEDIIRQHTSFKDAEYVAAEFPLKKSTATDHAAHVDYLMVSHKFETVLLIELKTDDGSYKTKQIQFYLKHKNFKGWYDKFKKIKMNGYKEKKRTLWNVIEDKLKGNFRAYKIKVIVLKPTRTEKDYNGLDEKGECVKFVGLKGLRIKTHYQEEWDLFRELVLDRICVNKLDKIIDK